MEDKKKNLSSKEIYDNFDKEMDNIIKKRHGEIVDELDQDLALEETKEIVIDKKKINEPKKEVEKVIVDNLDDHLSLKSKEDKKEVVEEKSSNKSKTIIILSIILILLILFIVIFIEIKASNRKSSNNKPSNSIVNSSNNSESNSNSESNEVEIPGDSFDYNGIMEQYVESLFIEIRNYYDKNKKVPSTVNTNSVGDKIVKCNETYIYSVDKIYLNSCSIDDIAIEYEYGEKIENKPTNSNTNTNTNTNKPNNKLTKPSSIASSSGTHSSTKFGSFEVVTDKTTIYGGSTRCDKVSDCYKETLTYDSDKSLKLGNGNGVAIIDKSKFSTIGDNYSVNITVKADVNQVEASTNNNHYGTSLLSIGGADFDSILWVGFNNGYLIVYSYKGKTQPVPNSIEETRESFLSIPFSSYNNKKVNIQITGTRNGKTVLYVNGSKVKEFNSGTEEGKYSFAMIGDLRPRRNMSFVGNVYEVDIYNKILSANEIKANWESAKSKYSIK